MDETSVQVAIGDGSASFRGLDVIVWGEGGKGISLPSVRSFVVRWPESSSVVLRCGNGGCGRLQSSVC